LILAIGTLLALISLLQHVGRVDGWLPDMNEQPRNRVGSLIGHNTGLSGYLLFPLSVAAWGLLAGRGPFRLASSLFLPLGLFVLVTAQSRSAWLAFILTAPLGMVGILWALGRRLSPRQLGIMAAVVAGVILAASALPRYNPLARQITPLYDRLYNDVFNWDQLRRETRWRVLFAGLPLIKEAPILGHGPGQFQWVYPPAQGRFLNKYLFETEAYTVKRTDVAHNDWLQFLIEFGLVGSLLATAAFVLLSRNILINWRQLPRGPERALIPALLMPVGGLMVQGTLDFPFHLAPQGWLSCLVVLLAAAPSTFGLPHSDSSASRTSSPDIPTSSSNQVFRPRAALLLTGIGSSFVIVPIVYRVAAMDWVSDAFYCAGNNHMTTSRVIPSSELERRRAALDRARSSYRQANRVNQFHGAAYENHSLTALNLANIQITMAKRARDHQDQKAFQVALESARSLAEVAISQANLSIHTGELRWHYSYLLLGRGYNILWSLRPDAAKPEQRNFAQSAATAYEAAFLLNPSDPDVLLERARLIAQPVIGQPQLGLELQNLVWRTDPNVAEQEFVDPARDRAYGSEYTKAREALQQQMTVFPTQWRLETAMAELHWMEAVMPQGAQTTATLNPQRRRQGLEKALEHLKLAETKAGQLAGPIAFWYQVVYASQYQWDKALRYADLARRDRTVQQESRVLELMIRRFISEGPKPLSLILPEVLGLPERHRIYERYRMLVFGQLDAAYTLAELAPGVAGIEPIEALAGITVLSATNNPQLAGVIARVLLKNDRILPDTLARLEPIAAQAAFTLRKANPSGLAPYPVPPWPVKNQTPVE
jgi:O-antigen ligase